MKKFSFFLVVLVVSMFSVSCGGDDFGGGDCSSSFSINSELNDEINAFANAATAYSVDPSSSNCQAYKDAAQGYLDALKSLRGCAEQQGQLSSYDQALANIEASFDSLTC